MKAKPGLLMLVLAGIGLAGCANLSPAGSSYGGASQPPPLGESAASAGQSAAAKAGTPEAQKHEAAFRQLDTNHDGLIDRQEFDALKLM